MPPKPPLPIVHADDRTAASRSTAVRRLLTAVLAAIVSSLPAIVAPPASWAATVTLTKCTDSVLRAAVAVGGTVRFGVDCPDTYSAVALMRTASAVRILVPHGVRRNFPAATRPTGSRASARVRLNRSTEGNARATAQQACRHA